MNGKWTPVQIDPNTGKATIIDEKKTVAQEGKSVGETKDSNIVPETRQANPSQQSLAAFSTPGMSQQRFGVGSHGYSPYNANFGSPNVGYNAFGGFSPGGY